MDQDMEGLDEESVRRILRILVGAAIRHEQQLTILEADRSYTFFFETKDLGIVQMLVQASRTWHQRFGPCSWDGSCLQKAETDEKMLRIMETAGWAQRTPLQWCDTEWNQEQRKALPSSKDNLPHEEAKIAVAGHTARSDVVHRFQSLKAMLLMLQILTVHQHATEIYQDLDNLANNSSGAS